MTIADKILERETAMAQERRNAAVAALWSGDEEAAMNSGLPSDELMRMGSVIEEAKSLAGAIGNLEKARKTAEKTRRALADYNARMEAVIAKLERERQPLFYEAEDARHALNAAENAARKLTALHVDNKQILPLDRLPAFVNDVLAHNSAEQARQEAESRRIKALEKVTAIERQIADLRIRRNEAAHTITMRGPADLSRYEEAEAKLSEKLEAAKREYEEL